MLQYRLSPSQETYDDVPTWLHTNKAEDSTPHPIYADFILFPRLREAFILKQVDIRSYEQFEFDFTTHLSVSWPLLGTLIVINDTHETVLNPAFESHVSMLENWSLDEEFARKYPHIAPLVNIRK